MRRALRSTLLAIGALALASCGNDDTMSPFAYPHLELTVSSVEGPTYSTTPDGYPVVTCVVGLHVVSNGTATAVWSAGMFRWFVGAERTTAVDSVEMTGQELTSYFETAQLEPGRSADTQLQISAGIPFGVPSIVASPPGRSRSTGLGMPIPMTILA